ncbi:hypothetical protein CLV92_11628 [Kineococcus xinjiangensis]|uniref:DUF6458 domain-containing protein n=1 Tax=Kineococcus xinjiangensis TaxID=512762 RepID=A0A2S6ID92_9ACTN|nr:DUF6458 family protein [Kineococcus xinjiangensis]PPK92167.1 hypothetical protein CLV92_11628 [Kineococcus xinjiangensis]
MRLGSAIVLIALGAILTFAVTLDVSGIDLSTVGVILMVVGGLGLLLELAFFAPRRRRVSSSYTEPVGHGMRRTTVDEV